MPSIPYFESETFKQKDFTKTELEKGNYEDCVFIACNLERLDLSNYAFMECEFVDCNLSLAKVNETALKDVRFKDCKLLGVNFGESNDFLLKLAFNGCKLNGSSFYHKKLKGTQFIDCELKEADFENADLSSSHFNNCDLHLAVFENTNLEKADLSTAFNFNINPEMNKIKKAKFSKDGLAGLLVKYQIEVE